MALSKLLKELNDHTYLSLMYLITTKIKEEDDFIALNSLLDKIEILVNKNNKLSREELRELYSEFGLSKQLEILETLKPRCSSEKNLEWVINNYMKVITRTTSIYKKLIITVV